MIVYLASPSSQQQAEHLADMPVLISFAQYRPYSEMTTGKKVDIAAYIDWTAMWTPHADAIAGLDDIQGDWRRSLANYERFPQGFPTFHDSDPPELLDDLIPLARERGGWIGLGLVPPRESKESWVRSACDRIPDDIHVHGWALRRYTNVRRIDSVDSSNWFRDAMKLRTFPLLSHLTYAECLTIIVKRYERWNRVITNDKDTPLFEGLE